MQFGAAMGSILQRKRKCAHRYPRLSRVGWLWANDVSVLRKVTSGLPGWIFLVQCPGLIFLAAHWSGPAASASIYSQSVWIISFEFVKVCGFRLGKLHWFLYLLLSYFYDPSMFIFRWSSNFVEKVVLNESMSAKMASRVSYLVYYYCI